MNTTCCKVISLTNTNKKATNTTSSRPWSTPIPLTANLLSSPLKTASLTTRIEGHHDGFCKVTSLKILILLLLLLLLFYFFFFLTNNLMLPKKTVPMFRHSISYSPVISVPWNQSGVFLVSTNWPNKPRSLKYFPIYELFPALFVVMLLLFSEVLSSHKVQNLIEFYPLPLGDAKPCQQTNRWFNCNTW